MANRHWSKLDSMGTFYSLTLMGRFPASFRFSVQLREEIDPGILQAALDDALKYYPHYNSRLRRGFFWYYLENLNGRVCVSEENMPICLKIRKDEDSPLFRVNYYKKRINIEVSHILSDGRGIIEFFKCIVTCYLTKKYDIPDVTVNMDSSLNERQEDSFDKYYKKKGQSPDKRKLPLFSYKYHGFKKKDVSFFEYHISAKKALEIAHEYNTTLTGLIISVLLCSYRGIMKEVDLKKAVTVDVPVDLRKYFDSDTSKNFFGLTTIGYIFKDNGDELADVVTEINRQLKEVTRSDNLLKRMNRTIRLRRVTAPIPLFIKEVCLNLANVFFIPHSTTSVSNLGVIKVDERLAEYIENFNVLTPTNRIQMTICSFGDDLSVGISSKYTDNDVIMRFCRYFSGKGIEGVINTNQED
ncbi:MAG: hypothetical protein II773_03500 [Oscillospiraceae bacterium]|nr:hypothetical protein [Oscillospiraceae bacterium]